MTNVLNKHPLTFITPASIKNGDQAAFLTVYNDLHIKVFRFFLKRVSADDVAKDLTQQTYIRLWQFRQTLSEHHLLEKQIFIIAHSLLINHFEKETYQKKIKIQQAQIEKQNTFSSDKQAYFELSDEVRTAIDTLPPVRKKVLLLKAFSDYNNREIAAEMNISVKTVEDHVTKAFRRMKEIMLFIIIVILHILSYPSLT